MGLYVLEGVLEKSSLEGVLNLASSSSYSVDISESSEVYALHAFDKSCLQATFDCANIPTYEIIFRQDLNSYITSIAKKRQTLVSCDRSSAIFWSSEEKSPKPMRILLEYIWETRETIKY